MKFILIAIQSLLILSINIVAQYQNIRVDAANSNQPEEVSIAINPVNPQFVSASANINHFFRSTNGGSSWTTSFLSSSFGVWGDPSVVYDELGNLYFGHLSNPPLPGYWIDRIVIQKSTDNGLTWNDGAGVGFLSPKNQDKEWLAVDMHSNLYKGNIYVTWTEFDVYGSSSPADSSRIKFSKSTDRGLTWSNAKTISDRSGDCFDEDNTVEGAVPCVGPNGEIYTSWTGPLGLMFDKSTDGGNTWGTDVFVSSIPGGWDYAVPGIYRCNGLPVTACDTSNSPFRGNIYINWSDQRNGTNNTDIFLAKSTDGGLTWSAPKKVNDDNTTRHQFFTWMTIDQTTGILYFVFYDRRNTTNNLTDVYVARSTDGGETFTNFKVSESSFNPNSNVFFGDYTNIAAFNRVVYPIWMRLDGSALTVYTAKIMDSSNVVPVELSSFTATCVNKKVLLNWTTASELNNFGFEIERKQISNQINSNSDNWVTTGFVNGNNTTINPSSYSFYDEPEVVGLYNYRLKQIDFNGNFKYSNAVEVNFINEFDYKLFQNYPNPISSKVGYEKGKNSFTTIEYHLPNSGFVSLKVYDVNGREVETLVNQFMPAGIHESDFSTKNLSSGIYLYRITILGENNLPVFNEMKKMIVIR